MDNCGCIVEQDICNIFRGDTLPFILRFEDCNGDGIDITGMKLTFTMKLNLNSGPGNQQVSETVVFKDNAGSRNGDGSIYLSSSKMNTVIPNRKYYYDFQLTSLDGSISTIGFGKVQVMQDRSF